MLEWLKKEAVLANVQVSSTCQKVLQRWSTGWMIGGSSPGRGWEFYASPPRPDRLWGPPSLLSNGYKGLSRWG